MKNYQCKKCATHIKSSSRPITFNCPSGANHQWTDLGTIGNDNYQCKKCAVVVQTKSHPSSFGCPAGSNHQWTKL